MNNDHRIPDAATWLAKHRHGELALELDKALAEVVAACLVHDKQGTVTLALKVTPSGDMVVIAGDVKAAPPKAAPSGAHYYATTDGALHTGDPYREPLPFPAHDLTDVADAGDAHDLTTEEN